MSRGFCMKRIESKALAPVLAALICATTFAADRATSPRFSAESYAAHVKFLASEELAGRGPGTDGIEKAARYIAEQFASCGLKPAGDDGTYFQSFPVTIGKKATDKCRLTWEVAEPAGKTFTAERKTDFVPMPFSGPGEFDGEVAFVGYGVSAEEYGYDDFADADLKGKILLMLRYEPKAKDESDFEGDDVHSDHALFSTKARLARKHDAQAILMVNPPTGQGEEDTLYALEGGGTRDDYRIPFLHVTHDLANDLLAAGGLSDLKTLQAAIDEKRERQTRVLAGVRVKGDSGVVKETAITRNVLGILPGTGDLAEEYVVVGGHYDHLGRTTLQFPGKKSRQEPDATFIHYGADDNASGAAGVMELARALRNGDAGPRRSILFMAFSAEEMGLLGSEYFVGNPTIPIERIVTMLNMDMIGRIKEDKLTVSGVGTSPGFKAQVEELATKAGFSLSTGASGFGPSDHTSFYSKKIPVLHFFSGLHTDYHKPTDTFEHINVEGSLRVLEVVASMTEAICTAPERPEYGKTKAPDKGKGRSGLKVRMGIMPSYTDDDEQGMSVTGVIEDGPADKAGMQDDDVILWIGETRVDDIYDYMDALAAFNPMDEVVVKVDRDGQLVALRITLEGSSR